MKPTPEQIAAMEARGWKPDEHGFGARAEVPNTQDRYALNLRVWRWGPEGWVADYGWSGVSFSGYTKHPSPLEAADEAEAWLRGVLGGFRFPWLKVSE